MEDHLNSRESKGLLMTSLFSSCYAEDIKEGEKVLAKCKVKDSEMQSEDQVLQGGDLFGEMLQKQMLRGKDLSGEVLCEEEERQLWDSMEDFILENPTPAYPKAYSPQATPRYVVPR